MNRRFFTPTALVAVALVACADTGSTGSGFYEDAALESDDQKASYGIGRNMGGQLRDAADRLDLAALLRGINDAMNDVEPAVTNEEMQPILQRFSQDIQAAAAERAASLATENAAEGEAFLAENGARDGVITTESGLQYEILRAGDGPSPTIEQRARLHYRGTLIDGTEFDSSYGGDPAEFSVGGLISGFSEALMLMQVGSHFRIVIPSDIAYGPGGSGGVIGPNATLIFEIELLEIL